MESIAKPFMKGVIRSLIILAKIANMIFRHKFNATTHLLLFQKEKKYNTKPPVVSLDGLVLVRFIDDKIHLLSY